MDAMRKGWIWGALTVLGTILATAATAHAAPGENSASFGALEGAMQAKAGVVLGVARSLLPIMFFIALGVEAFSSPTKERDFGGVVWKTLIVLVLLQGPVYSTLVGGLRSQARSIAQQVTPANAYERFNQSREQFLAANKPVKDFSKDPAQDSVWSDIKQLSNYAGNSIFSSLVGVVMTICGIVAWCINSLGTILAALLYIVGPLAIVLSIPRGSSTGPRWLSAFVSVAAWPVINGLLTALTVEVGMQSMKVTESAASMQFAALSSAFLTMVLALSTPSIASALVGGALGNLVGQSLHEAGSWARLGVHAALMPAPVLGQAAGAALGAAGTGAGMAGKAAGGAVEVVRGLAGRLSEAAHNGIASNGLASGGAGASPATNGPTGTSPGGQPASTSGGGGERGAASAPASNAPPAATNRGGGAGAGGGAPARVERSSAPRQASDQSGAIAANAPQRDEKEAMVLRPGARTEPVRKD